MRIMGHKTASVYARYNITSDADIRDAGAKLSDYLGKQATTATVVPLRAGHRAWRGIALLDKLAAASARIYASEAERR